MAAPKPSLLLHISFMFRGTIKNSGQYTKATSWKVYLFFLYFSEDFAENMHNEFHFWWINIYFAQEQLVRAMRKKYIVVIQWKLVLITSSPIFIGHKQSKLFGLF
jgi:hypothetical protein